MIKYLKIFAQIPLIIGILVTIFVSKIPNYGLWIIWFFVIACIAAPTIICSAGDKQYNKEKKEEREYLLKLARSKPKTNNYSKMTFEEIEAIMKSGTLSEEEYKIAHEEMGDKLVEEIVIFDPLARARGY
jgi:hypothetical protein